MQQFQSLQSRLASTFPRTIQDRGRTYFSQRTVEIRSHDETSLYGTVIGSEVYSVTIEVTPKKITLQCTCPYFTGSGPCKHLWAMILAADSQGLLRKALTDPPKQIGLEYGESDDDEEWDPEPLYSAPAELPQPRKGRRSTPARKEGWRNRLEMVEQVVTAQPSRGNAPWPESRKVYYSIDLAASLESQHLVVDVMGRDRRADGEWGVMKPAAVDPVAIVGAKNPIDRHILVALAGARGQGYYPYGATVGRFYLSDAAQQFLLPLICSTGHCLLSTSRSRPVRPRYTRSRHNNQPSQYESVWEPLSWDDGDPWEFRVHVEGGKGKGKKHVLVGELCRSGEQVPVEELDLTLRSGFVIFRKTVARLSDPERCFLWVAQFRRHGDIVVPVDQWDRFLENLASLPTMPRLDLPENLNFEEVVVAPQPRVGISKKEERGWNALRVDLGFNYEGRSISAADVGSGVYLSEEHRMIVRDRNAEAAAAARLLALGVGERHDYYERTLIREIAPTKLLRLVRTLSAEGWEVMADGKLYRQPGEFRLDVKSGVDWFELHGTVDFDGMFVQLPALLAALQKGESSIVLDDGTFGVLPEEWLKKFGVIADMGRAEEDHLRFVRAQVGLLDALLMAQPEVTVDATFERIRSELMEFKGVEPLDSPEGFTGTLRGYQREGLGWLTFLNRFGLGGCLADDMGTGKTVQVLALLESQRLKRRSEMDEAASRRELPAPEQSAPKRRGRPRKKRVGERPQSGKMVGPSLVVVPKSLVFNWKQEAARFAPDLRVLDHTGPQRSKTVESFADYDVVITTYGVLRNDVDRLIDVQFDYVILDEAQAIKNAETESAKAARLLDAGHRLAMSGTPVENHLGELWSLFEFLNPGLLGRASMLKSGTSSRSIDDEALRVLRQGLRPFILRRTKEQVAKDLPPKMEQMIYCELAPSQRKLYNELRDHYRATLLGLIDGKGIRQSKMQILEALLRLRQAACHPGLIDKRRLKEPSAKLETLLEHLDEVIDEGHKALVFSQFTSMLAIVRTHLDRRKIVYEYLDGKTRNRQAHVERFQTDDDCKLFLISLKAGGVGLNLTAAEYVFLLDPWWNPAVEAQAIDRAHRIGQHAQVFAYRLIARDTVEEKVLELQKVKRDLADAIITADNSLIRTISREDLESLLS